MEDKTGSILKSLQNASALVGLISGIIAIFVFIEKKETFILIIFISISIVALITFYIMFKGYKALRLRLIFSEKRVPLSMHSDWTVPSEKLDKLVVNINITILKKIELASLILLIADRLHTEAWSKTLVARFNKEGKSLSPVGSLTGTYMVLEALRIYQYHNHHAQNLYSRLAKLLTKEGIVVHKTESTAVGGIQLKSEELRHSSGFFLIRAFTSTSPSEADFLLNKRIYGNIKNRLVINDKDDLQGSAFAVAALLNSIFWLQNKNKFVIDTLNSAVSFFCELEELSQPGHPSWGSEPGSTAASNTAAQWVVVWLLSGLLTWKEIHKSKRKELANRLLCLFESNISLIPDTKRLLPHSFSGQSIRIPSGESMLATGIALYSSSLIYLTFKDKNILARSEFCLKNFIERITICGLNYSALGSLEKPIEGYLAWSACLLGLRPFIYKNNEQNTAVKTLSQAIMFNEDIKKFTQNIFNEKEVSLLNASVKKVNDVYLKSNVRIFEDGLFQPLGEINK